MKSDRNGQKNLALVLTGGGARAAYQVGFLKCLAQSFPDLDIDILTGISAGAINAAYIANYRGRFGDAVESLARFWRDVTIDHIFRLDARGLARNVFSWGASLLSEGSSRGPSIRGLVDTKPLRNLLKAQLRPEGGILAGVGENLREGRLQAVAVTAASYATGQTVTWVQGSDIPLWERPDRRSARTNLTVDHIMASAALPFFFPAIRIGTGWYGDGGIRLFAPLSPSLHLGADRILTISNTYRPSLEEADKPACRDYPPPAQIAGILMNAIFLDALDQDAKNLEQINELLARIPREKAPEGLRTVRAFILRPSRDLGTLAGTFEPQLPRIFRFLTRSTGTGRTERSDWLSMVMFDPRYTRQLMEIGEEDAFGRRDEIAALIDDG